MNFRFRPRWSADLEMSTLLIQNYWACELEWQSSLRSSLSYPARNISCTDEPEISFIIWSPGYTDLEIYGRIDWERFNTQSLANIFV